MIRQKSRFVRKTIQLIFSIERVFLSFRNSIKTNVNGRCFLLWWSSMVNNESPLEIRECIWKPPLHYLGVFKNNQSQIDEYLSALNPILRRTTEGKHYWSFWNERFFSHTLVITASSHASSSSTNFESEPLKSRMIIVHIRFLRMMSARTCSSNAWLNYHVNSSF